MIPVAETSSCLFSAFFSRATSGWRPLYMGTMSQVCLSPAHCRARRQEDVHAFVSGSHEPLGLFGKGILTHLAEGTEANHLVDDAGRVHLQLLFVAAQVLHQELDHAVLLDGRPAALLWSHDNPVKGDRESVQTASFVCDLKKMYFQSIYSDCLNLILTLADDKRPADFNV